MAQRDFTNIGQVIEYRVLGQPSLANTSLASRCPDPDARFNFSNANGGMSGGLVGDNAALEDQADELIAVATEQGFPLWRALGTIYRGCVKVNDGDVAEGISLLRGGLAAYRATGAERFMSHYTALLAKASEIAGQTEEAVTQLDDALHIVERTGERWFAAEVNRHKGQLMLRQGHSQAAEELYAKALSIAREQEAKLWELRAAESLTRLRRDQHGHAEARDLLAQVYDWFTEGFETPDLREAQALLDELA